jgi:hypothetical protein
VSARPLDLLPHRTQGDSPQVGQTLISEKAFTKHALTRRHPLEAHLSGAVS